MGQHTKRIGVLGGGQLGMMLAEAAAGLGLEVHFLDPSPVCSASFVTNNIVVGSFADEGTVLAFGRDKDIITVEIEHVSVEALEKLEAMGKEVYPSSSMLRMIKDKGLQKEYYSTHGIPTASYSLVSNAAALKATSPSFPMVVKARTGGYDGQGVKVIKTEADLDSVFDCPMVVEEAVALDKEIAVIVARSSAGEMKCFPAVEMEFDQEVNLVDVLLSPARVDDDVRARAEAIASQLAEGMGSVGVLAVEFFLMADGGLMVNEVAPRPHNSGHQTIEGNRTSQYTQHLLAITGQSLGDASVTRPSVMINLLGDTAGAGRAELHGAGFIEAEADVFLHYYHKAETRPHRKMGHLTILGDTLDEAMSLAERVRREVRVLPSQS